MKIGFQRNYNESKDFSSSNLGDIVAPEPTLNNNAEFNTDEFQALIELTEQINAGEVPVTEKLKEELGDRAIALAETDSLWPLQIENVIAHVQAVDPNFKDDAHDIVSKLYADRPATLQNIAHRVVEATQERVEEPSADMRENLEYVGNEDTIPIRLVGVAAAAHAVHVQTQEDRINKAINEAKEHASTDYVDEDKIEARVLESKTVDLPTGELPIALVTKELVNA